MFTEMDKKNWSNKYLFVKINHGGFGWGGGSIIGLILIN